MPTLTEKIDSREWTTGERPSVTLHYQLGGVADDLSAKSLLTSSTPTEYDGLARNDCSLEPIFVETAAGAGKWDCRVRHADAEDTAAKASVKVPVAAYVEKVYEEGNFAGLGIGT